MKENELWIDGFDRVWKIDNVSARRDSIYPVRAIEIETGFADRFTEEGWYDFDNKEQKSNLATKLTPEKNPEYFL